MFDTPLDLWQALLAFMPVWFHTYESIQNVFQECFRNVFKNFQRCFQICLTLHWISDRPVREQAGVLCCSIGILFNLTDVIISIVIIIINIINTIIKLPALPTNTLRYGSPVPMIYYSTSLEVVDLPKNIFLNGKNHSQNCYLDCVWEYGDSPFMFNGTFYSFDFHIFRSTI